MEVSKFLAGLGIVAGGCLLAACTPATNQTTLSSETQTQLAEVADGQGNSDVALTMYQSAAAKSPSDIAAQLRYADALARSGRISQAQRWLMQQMQSRPGDPQLQRASALVDIVGGNANQAIPKLDQLLATNPRDASAMTDKGVALDLLGRHADAQAQYHQALTLEPSDVTIKTDLAMSLMLAGDRRGAQAELEPVADTDEAPTRVKVNMGILYAANGDMARAQEIVRDQLDQNALLTLAKKVNETSPAN